jgi:methyltransferase-like protein
MEQYMDFVRNRTFRQTLFVHKSAPVTRTIDAQLLRRWHLASNAAPASRAPSIAPGVPEKFTRKELNLTTNSPIVKAAFLELAARWPASVPFEELVQAALARMAAEGIPAPAEAEIEGLRGRLALDMFQAFAATMVELRTDPVVLCLAPGEKPLASPVARLQSDRTGPVTNLRHEAVSLDPFSTQLLRLLDGTRDREALVDALAFVVRQGGLEVKQAGLPVGDIATIKKILNEAVIDNIPKLAKLGLLVA